MAEQFLGKVTKFQVSTANNAIVRHVFLWLCAGEAKPSVNRVKSAESINVTRSLSRQIDVTWKSSDRYRITLG